MNRLPPLDQSASGCIQYPPRTPFTPQFIPGIPPSPHLPNMLHFPPPPRHDATVLSTQFPPFRVPHPPVSARLPGVSDQQMIPPRFNPNPTILPPPPLYVQPLRHQQPVVPPAPFPQTNKSHRFNRLERKLTSRFTPSTPSEFQMVSTSSISSRSRKTDDSTLTSKILPKLPKAKHSDISSSENIRSCLDELIEWKTLNDRLSEMINSPSSLSFENKKGNAVALPDFAKDIQDMKDRLDELRSKWSQQSKLENLRKMLNKRRRKRERLKRRRHELWLKQSSQSERTDFEGQKDELDRMKHFKFREAFKKQQMFSIKADRAQKEISKKLSDISHSIAKIRTLQKISNCRSAAAASSTSAQFHIDDDGIFTAQTKLLLGLLLRQRQLYNQQRADIDKLRSQLWLEFDRKVSGSMDDTQHQHPLPEVDHEVSKVKEWLFGITADTGRHADHASRTNSRGRSLELSLPAPAPALSVDQLVTIRRQWDKFVTTTEDDDVDDGHVEEDGPRTTTSSSKDLRYLPKFFVTPTAPSSYQWRQYLVIDSEPDPRDIDPRRSSTSTSSRITSSWTAAAATE